MILCAALAAQFALSAGAAAQEAADEAAPPEAIAAEEQVQQPAAAVEGPEPPALPDAQLEPAKTDPAVEAVEALAGKYKDMDGLHVDGIMRQKLSAYRAAKSAANSEVEIWVKKLEGDYPLPYMIRFDGKSEYWHGTTIIYNPKIDPDKVFISRGIKLKVSYKDQRARDVFNINPFFAVQWVADMMRERKGVEIYTDWDAERLDFLPFDSKMLDEFEHMKPKTKDEEENVAKLLEEWQKDTETFYSAAVPYGPAQTWIAQIRRDSGELARLMFQSQEKKAISTTMLIIRSLDPTAPSDDIFQYNGDAAETN